MALPRPAYHQDGIWLPVGNLLSKFRVDDAFIMMRTRVCGYIFNPSIRIPVKQGDIPADGRSKTGVVFFCRLFAPGIKYHYINLSTLLKQPEYRSIVLYR